MDSCDTNVIRRTSRSKRRQLIAVASVVVVLEHVEVEGHTSCGVVLSLFLLWSLQCAVPDLPNPLGKNGKNQTRQIYAELKEIKPGEFNIFFVEDTCCTEQTARAHIRNESARLVLSVRQSCAIESTARVHPSWTVYLLYTCPLSADFALPEDGYVRKLFYYPNVHVVRMNVTEVFESILDYDFHNSGNIYHEWRHSAQHSGDLLGVALLWRFGGSYIHLNVVTVKPFTGVVTDFGVKNCGNLINVDTSGPGHKALEKLLKFVFRNARSKSMPNYLRENFNLMILDECHGENFSEVLDECNVFRMFKSVFYPDSRKIASLLFDQQMGRALVNELKKASPVVCAWKGIENSKVRVGSDQAYGLLAEMFCPLTYTSCGDTF